MLSLPPTVTAVGWLIRETFRQALATRLFWLLLGGSLVCIVFCLGLRIEEDRPIAASEEVGVYDREGKPLPGTETQPGRLALGFGALGVPLFRDGQAQVQFLQVLLAKWVAGAVGTLLALIWTAGFLPDFLQPDSAAVLLAKPLRRRWLLAGKCLGVFVFVGFHAAVFVLGTWLALGVATGIWLPGYLLSLPLLLLNFAIVSGASALVAVLTRSTAACVFGSILFWMTCFMVNAGRHSFAALKLSLPPSRAFRWSVEATYWLLPKPADLALFLDRCLQSGAHFRLAPEFAESERLGAYSPALSVLSSLTFTAVLLIVAARHFEATDY